VYCTKKKIMDLRKGLTKAMFKTDFQTLRDLVNQKQGSLDVKKLTEKHKDIHFFAALPQKMMSFSDIRSHFELPDGTIDIVAFREILYNLDEKLNNFEEDGQAKYKKDMSKEETDWRLLSELPAKYEIFDPGVFCEKTKDVYSEKICQLHTGAMVIVVELSGNRAKILDPEECWFSMVDESGKLRCRLADSWV